MKPNSYKYAYSYMVAAQFDHNNATDQVRAVAFYNYEAYHTTAISLSLVDNTLLQHFVGANYSIETHNNHRQPAYSKWVAEDVYIGEMIRGRRRLVGLFGSTLFTLVTNFCAIYLISEREGGTKRLQLNSKLHPVTFWAVTFVSDYFVLLLSVAGIYIAFFVGDLRVYTDGVNLPATGLFFLMYAFAALPMTYVVSNLLSTTGVGMSLFTTFTLIGKRLRRS